MKNQNWNDWKFQIHWNKIEWANPRNRIERENPFFVSSKKICLKDNNKTANWVSNSKLKTLDTEGFQKKKIINYIQASLNGTIIEKSDSGRQNNTDFYKKLKNKKLKRQMLIQM